MAHENATPRPWIHDYDQHGSEQVCIYADASEDLIAEMHVFRPDSQILADAALIVEAVNAYDTLRAENERLKSDIGFLQVSLQQAFERSHELIERLADRDVAVLSEDAQ